LVAGASLAFAFSSAPCAAASTAFFIDFIGLAITSRSISRISSTLLDLLVATFDIPESMVGGGGLSGRTYSLGRCEAVWGGGPGGGRGGPEFAAISSASLA
jgi:hypothetical protein